MSGYGLVLDLLFSRDSAERDIRDVEDPFVLPTMRYYQS